MQTAFLLLLLQDRDNRKYFPEWRVPTQHHNIMFLTSSSYTQITLGTLHLLHFHAVVTNFDTYSGVAGGVLYGIHILAFANY